MSRLARFLLVLFLGLGLLSGVGWMGLSRTMGQWFERDLELRAALAVASARSSLGEAWASDRAQLELSLANRTVTIEKALQIRQGPKSNRWFDSIPKLPQLTLALGREGSQKAPQRRSNRIGRRCVGRGTFDQ